MRCWASLLIVGTIATTVAAEPAEFRVDARHSGTFDAAGVPVLHGLKWRFAAGGPIVSTPVVQDGAIYFGSNDKRLYALDDRTGALRWKYETQGRVSASPAVAGGRVYFGSYDGNFYALDAATGTLAWKFATEGERRFSARNLHGMDPAAETMPDPFDVFLSSPVITGETVYFGSGDGNVYALAAASGALRWKFRTGGVVHASPAIANGVVYVGSWDTYLYALDAASGKMRWKFKTGDDAKIHNQEGIQSSAVVADGIVYFGCRDSHLYALDAASGAKRWSVSTGDSWIVSSPAVRDGVVYFATSDSGLIEAVDSKNGALRFSLDFKHWPFFSSPTLAGNLLYIGSNAGQVLAIDLTTRKVAWTFQTDAAKNNGPAYTKADGSPNVEVAFKDFFYDDVIIGTDRMRSVGAVMSTPIANVNALFIGSWDGHMYAVN